MIQLTKQIITTSAMLEELKEFLKHQHLPFHDIIPTNNLFIVYRDASNTIIASGGLEYYNNSVLLRSLAVAPSQRGKHIGNYVVDDLLHNVRKAGIQSVFLLTETARDFFLKKGFSVVSRDQVPEAIKQSTEFSHVCPASAVCMHYPIITP